MGPDLPFAALCGECDSDDLCHDVGHLPVLLPLCQEGDDGLHVFRGTGTHGLDQLYLAVADGSGAVLWPRHGMGHVGGTGHDRVHRHRGFPASDVGEQAVAPLFPVRPSGMGLAHADLREVLQDREMRGDWRLEIGGLRFKLRGTDFGCLRPLPPSNQEGEEVTLTSVFMVASLKILQNL